MPLIWPHVHSHPETLSSSALHLDQLTSWLCFPISFLSFQLCFCSFLRLTFARTERLHAADFLSGDLWNLRKRSHFFLPLTVFPDNSFLLFDLGASMYFLRAFCQTRHVVQNNRKKKRSLPPLPLTQVRAALYNNTSVHVNARAWPCVEPKSSLAFGQYREWGKSKKMGKKKKKIN